MNAHNQHLILGEVLWHAMCKLKSNPKLNLSLGEWSSLLFAVVVLLAQLISFPLLTTKEKGNGSFMNARN